MKELALEVGTKVAEPGGQALDNSKKKGELAVQALHLEVPTSLKLRSIHERLPLDAFHV
jgi:hypothetical protein